MQKLGVHDKSKPNLRYVVRTCRAWSLLQCIWWDCCWTVIYVDSDQSRVDGTAPWRDEWWCQRVNVLLRIFRSKVEALLYSSTRNGINLCDVFAILVNSCQAEKKMRAIRNKRFAACIMRIRCTGTNGSLHSHLMQQTYLQSRDVRRTYTLYIPA